MTSVPPSLCVSLYHWGLKRVHKGHSFYEISQEQGPATKYLLYLFLTVVSSGALQCVTCTDSLCANTTSLECSSGLVCVTAASQGRNIFMSSTLLFIETYTAKLSLDFLASVSGSTVQQIIKGCILSAVCPYMGLHTISANLGATTTLTSYMCCNTDDCNSHNINCKYTQKIKGFCSVLF
uniref:UPAR/Ly6 domain-containing protein n=1 Tax=Mola mola TaxID=94237 RepID=A0A3Q3X9G9_MOLML